VVIRNAGEVNEPGASETMNETEPKHSRYGTPMSEWIKLVEELDIDAVGLWQIVPTGREYFGLEGAALDDFIRRSLLEHFAYGAVPVRHVPGDPNVWTIQTNYGETPDAMAKGILEEWNDQDRPDPGLGDLWLALPRIANHPFSKKKYNF
jgi:hypothetical protein